jgi:hypothetical protein
MTNNITNILSTDKNKRKTLKAISGLAAGAALTAVPGISAATIFGASGSDQLHELPAQLEGMLVSMPNISGETLILKNLTDKAIRIDHFQANKIIFDGEIVDCNDACAMAAINIPANQDVLIRFKPQGTNLINSPAGEFLDLDSDLYHLPAGTRVVPLAARMNGNAAMLSKKPNVAAA